MDAVWNYYRNLYFRGCTDSSLAIGEAYYEEIFEGQENYNVAYKGDYISRFRLNDGMTYLKHNDMLEKNEIAGILKLCEQYTKMFVEANEYLKEMMEGMVASKDDADGQM